MNKVKPKTAEEVLSSVYSTGLAGDYVDLYRIASEFDVKIVEDKSLADDIIGEISCESGDSVIKINPLNNSYEPRKNFTIAHELGHYFLHLNGDSKEFVDNKRTMNRTDSFWDAKESEANNFAANLLMPVSLIINNGKRIIDTYKRENDTQSMPKEEFIFELSKELKVSRESLVYRLKNLGIIK